MTKTAAEKNCIVEIYKGVPIRRYETLRLRIDSVTKKKLIDISEVTGMTDKKIVCNSSRPCSKCEGTFVEVFDLDGNLHKIPKGILSRKNLL